MSKSKHCFYFYKIIAALLFLSYMCFLLSPLQTYAQAASEKGLPFITNYTAKTYNALPQTWSIQEDERGIMYFGIQNYMLEYDGVKWRKITIKNNEGASVIRSMAKHKDGLIYYGAFGEVGYLDYDSLGQKQTYSLRDLIPAANRDFLDVWTTQSTESGIYFQSREYIFRLDDKKPGAKKHDMMMVWKPQTKFMFAFYLDGNYYVHQQGLGLYKMVNDSLVLIPGSEFTGKERMQIMLPYKTAGNEKQYLVGLFYSGLYLFNGKTFQPFATKADPVIKSGAVLYKGLQLRNGNYVLSTAGKGIVIIDAQGNLLQKINRDVGLQDESIYAPYEDRKGTLWLGMDNGISRVEIASPLTKFTLQSGINTGVLTVTRFEDNLYLGTSNGLLAFDKTTSFFNPVSGIPLNQVFALYPTANQLLIPGDGLFSVNDKKAVTIRSSISGDLNLSVLKVPDKFPNILLGGGNFGVAVFNRNSKPALSSAASDAWQFEGYIPGITDQIWSFSENKDGSIWAGTQAGLVYLVTLAVDEKGNIDMKKTSFKKYGPKDGLVKGLGQVYSIKGISYFIADSSLYTFDDKAKRFIPDTTFGHFNKGGGNTEFDMVEDDKGRVWIRFGKELRIAYPKPEGRYRFDNTLLSSINELTIQKIFTEKNGIVWLCTTDGLIRYDENIENNNDKSFKTILRSASAGKNGLTTTINPGAKPVAVSYKDNSLRFEYAAPYFEQEEKTQYQTWLEGFEKDWSDFDNNYYKEYTNLPPGDYHFHVRAKNIYQTISEEAVYHFSIYPPWYVTWWAYMLYAFAALAILYTIVKWRTHQLHEKHRELEKTVADRTVQLSQRVEELAVINSVQDGLVKEIDMQAIYDLVGNKIRDLFDAQAVIIANFNYVDGTEEFKYALEEGKRFYLDPRTYDKLRTHLIQVKQKVVINNLAEADKWLGRISLPGTKHLQSALFVPLIVGDNSTGYISLQNVDRENAFSQSDARLLETLSNSMSVALESARRFDETVRLLKETEQRTAELAVINSVQEGLAKELDMQGIYDLVGDRVQKLFHTHAVIIATLDLVNRIEHFNYVFENGEKYKLDSRPVNKLREKLIDKKQTIYIATEDEARNDYGITAIGDTKMPRALMFVPLLSGSNIKGYVSIQNIEKENAFSESDIRLLETLANSMSVALENARLFDETNRLLKETEQRTGELAVINSVQEGLVREMDMQAIYDLVGNRICELFDTQTVIIRTFDHSTGNEQWRYAIEKGERIYSEPRPFMWANKQLIQSKQSLLINENYIETATKYGGTGVSKVLPPRSAMFVPMIVGDVVRGSVSLHNIDKENAFKDPDLRLLTTLTNSMSVALENARLFDETTLLLAEAKQRATELSTVNSISKALASQLDADNLIQLVGDQLKDLFKANIVYLALLNPKTRMINFAYQYGEVMPSRILGDGLTSKIILTGEPLLLNKDVDEKTEQMGVQRMGLPASSYLGVPIPVGDQNIGVLSVQSTEQENRFNENDLRLLSTIASSVGVALRNATLFEEVKLAKREAESASRLAEKANEAKSAFLSTVSHELRTPLTSVLGFAKIIQKRLNEKIFPIVDKSDAKTEKTISQISENLHVVISEGERLTHLINDVLDLAKIEAGKMDFNQENVSLPEVAERAIAATTALFDQKALKLIRKIDTTIPEIIGDKDKLIQVIINLISNSVKFTDEGAITCSVFKQNNELIVSIADTGIGIAPEDFDAVFEQFKQVGGDTLTDKPKGTGLGLPICKEIVEHLGGRIWLESERGKGSTFSFALPIKKPTAERPVHLEDLVRQLKEQVAYSQLNIAGQQAAKILIVDDDDSIRSLLQQELGDAGYNVDQASNGKEALARVRANRPNLIILDIMMPEMNGFDTAAVLKNDPETMDIPIIVLSVVQDKARGFRIGIDRYLTKPIDTGLLFNEIGSLLEQGKSKKKVMIVDEDSGAVSTLTDVLKNKGYEVMESNENELLEKAVANLPDIIIISSVLSGKQDIVKTLRFEKGLENVLFVVYQ